MRIAHVITRMILGGAQENTLLTVEGLARRWGDDVVLITGPALGPEGSLLERAYQGGLDVRLVPQLRRAVNPVRDWLAYRSLVRLLRGFQPQVVHTHSSKAGILGRFAAAQVGVPIIVHTIHGMPFHANQNRFTNGFYIAAERWAARYTRAFITVADAMTQQAVAAGIAPPEKFTTIYSGMEVAPFLNPPRARDAVRRELGYGDEHVVIGKIARLFDLKGHEYVIAAAREVVEQHPNVRFLVVGNGALRERLKRQIAKIGLSDHFQFTGLVPPERIPELLAAMDVVVHCSLREGLARVLPQALIAGKPVVSYDVDGAREVVLPNRTGFLLPPKSVRELAEALIELAGDPALRSRLGQTGRSLFTEQFRHENMVARIRELYLRYFATEPSLAKRVAGLKAHAIPAEP